jgi:predicted acyl esterase
VKAVVPGWADFDVYRSPIRPYGLLTAFIGEWGDLVAAMDRNDGAVLRSSVRRVDADSIGAERAAAVAEHARDPDVGRWARYLEFRDDRLDGGPSYAELGPVYWKAAIEQSNVPMLVLVSWLDAGTAEGALDRLRTFRNPQKLVIMASSHGGGAHASPYTVTGSAVPTQPAADSLAQLRLQFFDHYLKGVRNGVPGWPAVRYYTLGEEAYRTTEVWPPAGTAGDEHGQSRYLTEGGLRLIHRATSTDTLLGSTPYQSFERRAATPMQPGRPARVTFRMLPASVIIRKGHRLRLALAGADAAVFERVPAAEEGMPTLNIHRDPRTPSLLELPVVPPTRR